jgi:N-acetylglucosamine transport system permease protein
MLTSEKIPANIKSAGMKNSVLTQRRRERNIFLAVMILPAIILYSVLRFIPAFIGLAISFFSWKGVSLKMDFVGLKNYASLLQDEIFWKSFGNHMYLFVLNTVIVFTLAVALSVLLTGKHLKERSFYRITFFFPTVVPAVIINVVWISVFNPNIGLLNGLLQVIGLQGQNWLGDADIVKNSVLFVMVWKSLGFYMVLFMAGILNIPTSLFEAARIDGCNEVRQTWVITIPLMWEQIRTSLLFFVVTSCGVGFNVVYMMTKGGPSRSSEIMTTYMYMLSFGGGSKFGYASAVAMAILIITTTIALLIMRATKREVYEM